MNRTVKPYYESGGITIYHGDCREILPAITGVDVVITDPPYSQHTHNKQWIGSALTNQGAKRVAMAHKGLGFDPLTDELRAFAATQFERLSRRWVITFCDLEMITDWKDAVEAVGLEYIRACVWDKVDSAPQFTGDRPASGAEVFVCAHRPGKKVWNGGGRRNVFRCPVNGKEKGSKPHPSTKPLGLMLDIVGLFSLEGETVLDPFMGSGTTLRACKDLGRKAIGIELEEKYCEIAAGRLAQENLFVGGTSTAEPQSMNLPGIESAESAGEQGLSA
jgi:DNA modification methylase